MFEPPAVAARRPSYDPGGNPSSIFAIACVSAASFSAGVAFGFSVSVAVPRQTISFAVASTRSTMSVPTGICSTVATAGPARRHRQP
jgi:hypothetical protein